MAEGPHSYVSSSNNKGSSASGGIANTGYQTSTGTNTVVAMPGSASASASVVVAAQPLAAWSYSIEFRVSNWLILNLGPKCR